MYCQILISNKSSKQKCKSSSTKVGRYKGNETDIEFPKEIKGKKMNGVAGTTSRVPDNYKNIVSVVLPEGYTSIGDYAFYGCINLEKIIFQVLWRL